jgi:serine/threonine-protein kinase
MNPGMKLGPFVIEEEVGSGAMGAVYRAQYRDKNLRVAVKVMAPGIGSNETSQARFQREAEILKNLQHPNIVRLLAVGRYKSSPFYAMEFIEGETLEAILQRRGRLPWEEVIRLGQQLCAALQHAHDCEVVHRDLKPSNLMLLSDGTLKLTDFGIAKALDMSGLTATNCTVGTASYMSPEQCRGDKDIGHKSDLYSMGVLFYELVTGRKPFHAESTMDMFLQHVKGKFKRPSVFEPNMPVWLDNLICQLLEKKTEDRPASARVAGQTLAEIMDKVEAQQSAGLERATARTREKGHHRPRLDDADREVARTLLSRRKKNQRKTPFYQQNWFTILTVALLLGGLGYGIYYVFFVPPSLTSLRKQAKDLLDTKDDYATWMELRDGPLKQFQVYYAQEKGPTADLMREWSDSINVKIAEHQMLKRRDNKLPPDAKGEVEARQALNYEDLGYLSEALKAWMALADKQLKDSDPEKRAWGLVGKKRYDQLKTLEKQWQEFAERVVGDKEFVPPSKIEQLAAEAFRAQADWAALDEKVAKENSFSKNRPKLEEKLEAARGLWDSLRKKTIEDDEQRNWYLLAAFELHELNEAAKKYQAK